MGVWGVGSFENDDALDWLDEFVDSPSTTALVHTLTVAAKFPRDDYLEITEAASAIAAAEIVAAWIGKPAAQLPDDAKNLAANQRSLFDPKMPPLAQRAVRRVTAAESELAENWIEESNRQLWLEAAAALTRRLSAPFESPPI